jgi:hypothetical protein
MYYTPGRHQLQFSGAHTWTNAHQEITPTSTVAVTPLNTLKIFKAVTYLTLYIPYRSHTPPSASFTITPATAHF